MKAFFVFLLFAAVTVAFGFPSGEPEPEPPTEVQTEMKKEEQNTLAEVEGNPKGDNAEDSEAERAKRFIFFGIPFVYSYPAVYSYPVVARTKVVVV